jgi:hypothetical protein
MADHKTVVVESGGDTVFLTKANLGFSPADTHRNFQISVHNLDGGTYTVSYYPVNCSHLIEFQDNAPESAAVVASQTIDFLYSGLVISFNNLGAGAAPKVHATFWPRGL